MTALDPQWTAAGRLWAAHHFPYLSSALFATSLVPGRPSGAVAVDEYWRVYVDADAVGGWSAEELGIELVHLTGHLLRAHADRGRSVGLEGEEIAHWVDAADAELNDDLPPQVARPAGSVTPTELGCDDGRFAEEYYRFGRVREHEGRDCGSGAHGHQRDWDDDPPEDGSGVEPEEAEQLRHRVAADVMDHERRSGEVPPAMVRWAENVLSPRVDWRRVLAAELRRGLAEASGAIDYSYSRVSRRASAVDDVVLPALRQPVPHVAVVCDTSASMDDAMLGRALTEIDGILGSAGVRADSVRVLTCDTVAGAAQRVRSSSAVELVGGGGTDMGAGLAAASALRPRPQVAVVVTDGYTPWPAESPPCRVVVAVVGDDAPPAPEWATTVLVADE